MAVFRVEKNSGYTVMSNHHLRNRALSLKAKGLLSQMLSLPEDWDYTLQGLARINRESIDAIRQVKPGDLVFFKGTYDTPGVSHCGIYVGNSIMLHCGDPISYTNLNSKYWQEHFYSYGRLP